MSKQREVDSIFWSKYTRTHMPFPGNGERIFNLIHGDVSRIVEALETENAELQARCDMLEEEVAALRAENEELEDMKGYHDDRR